MSARGSRGFTLLEVMIALAILALSLTMLLRSATRSILAGEESHYLTVVTELARHKMSDLEDQLRKDGFAETDQKENGDFSDEGWPQIRWEATIDTVELPSYDKMMSAGQGENNGSGEDNGTGSGMESLMGLTAGAFGGSDMTSTAGAAFMEGQFELIKTVLKASIRKVTLTLSWTVLQKERTLPVILYITDAAGMQKTLGGFGASPQGGGGGLFGGGSPGQGGATGGGAPTRGTPGAGK